MEYSENQKALLAFCKAVRTNHGVDRFQFTKLLGASKTPYYDFENGDQPLGRRVLQVFALKLGLTPQMVAACVEPDAGPVLFPDPNAIRLTKQPASKIASPCVLIDENDANKILALIKAAGKPIQLPVLLELLAE